ncbi:acyltransferase family protein [Scytonema sp. UIC 10036]|uniref:acyltransferase family protein n=1 Tax=Scytonema sp. UIC 10036 TaxID=2304196 RepID=UPI0012DA2880|nr:acyltransferase family protein [Scytonema sp. UIC 10036]MUH00833.1 acyltransferase family protein [Scytonema sp. UIC 10036]
MEKVLIAGLSIYNCRSQHLLLAIPLAAIEASLRPRWPGFQNLYDDWANFCLYLLYFIYGYLIPSDARFGYAIDKHLTIALSLAVSSMLVLFSCWETGILPEQGYSLGYILYQVLRGFDSWFWIVVVVGLGRRYLNFSSKLLQYASAAAYPFYLLHQTVLVTIGFYVVHWNANVMEKFWIISTTSLIATIALSVYSYQICFRSSHQFVLTKILIFKTSTKEIIKFYDFRKISKNSPSSS